MKILLVEDEKQIRDLIALNLSLENYEVKTAEHGEIALELFKTEEYDLVILDVMIPFINGLDLCKMMKTLKPKLPILILSAKGNTQDRILGLKQGADDYLGKPFDLEELLLRISKLISRPLNATKEIYRIGKNTIDFAAYQIRSPQRIFDLKEKEMRLLQLLIKNKNHVVSRLDILNQVWEKEELPSSRTVDNFITRLRKMIELDSKNPKYIQSVRGVGYKFEDPQRS